MIFSKSWTDFFFGGDPPSLSALEGIQGIPPHLMENVEKMEEKNKNKK